MQQKKPVSKKTEFDPFAMDPTPKQPNMFQNSPSPQMNNNDPFDFTNQPSQQPKSIPKAQPDDLDIFFGTPSNQPMNIPQNPPPQNRPSNVAHANKNDVSGFTVYNELNTSNMKDMSALGINNFLDINDKNNTAQKPKFDLREEPSGTIFDNDQNNNMKRYN